MWEMILPAWVVATTIFGQQLPAKLIDDAHFRSEASCMIYLHLRYGDELVEKYKLVCVERSKLNDWSRFLKRRED